jgi:transketolase
VSGGREGIRGLRNPTDLRDPRSFDHVGRDIGATSLISGAVLAELAREDERIVCGTADIEYVTHLAEFRLEHPERAFQFGIGERTMVGAAAGMASFGYVPYVSTFASFLGILAYENIRTDLAYPRLPVRLLATHSGISMGFFGSSHHATEDIAALRAVAGLTILSPSDGPSYAALLRATVDREGPIYFRLGRGRDPDLHTGDLVGFGPGDPTPVHAAGERLLIVATGSVVAPCVEAARALAAELGEDVTTVLDAYTLKPFGGDAVAAAVGPETRVLVVEEHNVEGGLGSIVREALAERGVGARLYKHGLQDEFSITGPPAHLYAYYGIDAAGIATVARRLLEHDGAPAPGELLWTATDREAVMRSVIASRRRRRRDGGG